jgi:hypothetical protein
MRPIPVSRWRARLLSSSADDFDRVSAQENIMRRWNGRIAVAAAICLLAGQLHIASAGTNQEIAPDAGPSTDGPVAGVSLGEWTARWWRWALDQPIEPFLDPDGRLCRFGQDGPVWFLAGTDGSFEPRRECVVPEGKHVLVPIINMIYWQPRGRDTPCRDLQANAAVNNDRLVSAVVLLDGKPLGDMRAHRVRSDGCFRMRPDESDSRMGAADGYWLMLKPLSRGRHTLQIGANYAEGETGYGGMQQNFEYVLDVGGKVLTTQLDRPMDSVAVVR